MLQHSAPALVPPQSRSTTVPPWPTQLSYAGLPCRPPLPRLPITASSFTAKPRQSRSRYSLYSPTGSSPPPNPPPPWTVFFQEHLDPQRRWRIYADGSWKVAPSPNDFFLEPSGAQGGGAAFLSPRTPKTGPRPPFVSYPSRFQAWPRSR